MTNKVAITGVGMVTPLGATSQKTVSAWRQGKARDTRTLAELAGSALAGATVACPAAFDAAERLGGRKMLKFMSESAVLGCMAAREAIDQAEIHDRYTPEQIGLYAATGLAAADIEQVASMLEHAVDSEGAFSVHRFGEEGLAQTNPLLSFRILANMPACLVSILNNLKGPSLIFTPWESQAALALQEAWFAVAHGAVDCAVVGGADTPSHPSTFVYLRQNGWLREHEVPANAGAYLVLERYACAQQSNKPILATLDQVDIQVASDSVQADDPLSARMGRTFVAAPFLLTALACHDASLHTNMLSADGWDLTIQLGERPCDV